MTACRNRALNRIRDEGRARDRTAGLAALLDVAAPEEPYAPAIPDDRLRLMFICCHPVLPLDAQAALTLRMAGGLSTVDIARAWHVPESPRAQRSVRAQPPRAQPKGPAGGPSGDRLPGRL